MRRPLIAALLIACWCSIPIDHAHAQYGGGGGGAGGGMGHRGPGGGDDDQQSQDDAKKKKRDEEWNGGALQPLPGAHNAGPCPYVKVLYDAARYVELKDDKAAAANVGYTGEIQGLSAGCLYKASEPIRVEIELLFAFGRGPQAQAASKDYRYWVAVTDRNKEILAKQYFDVRAPFQGGQDRVLITDRVNGITIPRANEKVSGSNFEILIGFDVTPQMADFNRQGKRFRVNAGSTTVAQRTPAAQQ